MVPGEAECQLTIAWGGGGGGGGGLCKYYTLQKADCCFNLKFSYLSCVTSLIIPYRGGREVTSVAQLSLIIPYG